MPSLAARSDEGSHDEAFIILVAAIMGGIWAALQQGGFTPGAILAGVVVMVVGAPILAGGLWLRRGPAWWWWLSRRAFKIVRPACKNLSIGQTVRHFEVLPKHTQVLISSFDVRFMECRTLWRKAQPVSSGDIHIINCEWKSPHPEHQKIPCDIVPDDNAGGFVGTFSSGPQEFKTDSGLDLEITVECNRPWSGYLSFGARIPGKPTSAYGRKRASVGPFRFRSVIWKGTKNKALRVRSWWPWKKSEHVTIPARTEPLFPTKESVTPLASDTASRPVDVLGVLPHLPPTAKVTLDSLLLEPRQFVAGEWDDIHMLTEAGLVEIVIRGSAYAYHVYGVVPSHKQAVADFFDRTINDDGSIE